MNFQKLYSLIEGSRFDICNKKCTFDPINFIYRSKGKVEVKLLKILMSNDCKSDCKYCPNAWKKGFSITPKDLEKLFFTMKENKLIDGIFISSAVNSDPDTVMEKILEAAELIRRKFNGYIHLKIMPGCSKHNIKRALEIANRVSINAETVSQEIMSELSSFKDLKEILRIEKQISREVTRFKKSGLKKSFTTQIIVGVGENDVEILKSIEKHYKLGVSRVYFSAFTPIRGTPFENRKRENKRRIINLYRVDALIRKYGYKTKDFTKIIDENLPNIDPKILFAESHENLELIQIPGIGPKLAKMLEDGYSFTDLKRMGFSIKRAVPYLKQQLKLSDFNIQ